MVACSPAPRAEPSRRAASVVVASKLLIIDEIGTSRSAPPGRTCCSSSSPSVMSEASIILTSNQSLTGWGDVFGDPIIATAILDRCCITPRC